MLLESSFDETTLHGPTPGKFAGKERALSRIVFRSLGWLAVWPSGMAWLSMCAYVCPGRSLPLPFPRPYPLPSRRVVWPTRPALAGFMLALCWLLSSLPAAICICMGWSKHPYETRGEMDVMTDEITSLSSCLYIRYLIRRMFCPKLYSQTNFTPACICPYCWSHETPLGWRGSFVLARPSIGPPAARWSVRAGSEQAAAIGYPVCGPVPRAPRCDLSLCDYARLPVPGLHCGCIATWVGPARLLGSAAKQRERTDLLDGKSHKNSK